MKEKNERKRKEKINGYIIKIIYDVSVTWSNYDIIPQTCDKSFKDEGPGKELGSLHYTQWYLPQGTSFTTDCILYLKDWH